jgi:nucleoside-diphosphate-sugar epimerase
MKTVLVTGGSGFVGSRVIPALLARGFRVHNIDVQPSKEHAALSQVGDICSAADCASAMRGVDAMIHLAALYRDDVRPRERYYEVNVNGTQRLIEAAVAHDVRQIVFASSFSVYGLDAGERLEDGALSPVNDYGHSKLQAEQLLRQWAAAAPGRSLRMVRPSVIFGEGNRGNVYTLIEQIASGRFAMIGAGRNQKSMAYVENVAQFMVFLLADAEPGVKVYNYADKPDLTVNDIVGRICGALDIRVRRLPLSPRAALLAGATVDVIARVTGRSFTITLERIKKFLADTTLPTQRVEASGFSAPVPWQDALVRTVVHEFGTRRPDGHDPKDARVY